MKPENYAVVNRARLLRILERQVEENHQGLEELAVLKRENERITRSLLKLVEQSRQCNRHNDALLRHYLKLRARLRRLRDGFVKPEPCSGYTREEIGEKKLRKSQ